MNRGLILQGHHAKYTPFQFVDYRPKSVPVVFLRLSFSGMLDDSDTPLLSDVGPLAQDLILKILREPVFLHEANCFPSIASIILG